MTPTLPVELFGLERPGFSTSLLVMLLLFGLLIGFSAVAGCTGTGSGGGSTTSDDLGGTHPPESPGSPMTTIPLPIPVGP